MIKSCPYFTITGSIKSGITQISNSNNSKNPGFTVFNENAEEQKGIAPSIGDWQLPPTRQLTTKENTQKAGKWTETTVQQQFYVAQNDGKMSSERHNLCLI